MYIPPGRIHCHRPIVSVFGYPLDDHQLCDLDDNLDEMFDGDSWVADWRQLVLYVGEEVELWILVWTAYEEMKWILLLILLDDGSVRFDDDAVDVVDDVDEVILFGLMMEDTIGGEVM